LFWQERELIEVISFFIDRKEKFIKFFIIGLSLTILNLLLIYFFIEVLLFNTKFLENIANAVTIEIGIILSFILNRNWTWKDVSLNSKKNIFFQLIRFHTVVGFTAILRIVLFIIFQSFYLDYLFNTLLCIFIASIFNFILYDSKVFNEKK
jgi:dolichol-phosphate mannosyltransferase